MLVSLSLCWSDQPNAGHLGVTRGHLSRSTILCPLSRSTIFGHLTIWWVGSQWAIFFVLLWKLVKDSIRIKRAHTSTTEARNNIVSWPCFRKESWKLELGNNTARMREYKLTTSQVFKGPKQPGGGKQNITSSSAALLIGLMCSVRNGHQAVTLGDD